MKFIKLLTVTTFAIALMAGSVFADQADCCKKAAADGKTCTHKCCIAAAKDGKECEKCGGKGEIKKADKKDAPKTDKK